MNWAKLRMFVFAFVFPHSACSLAWWFATRQATVGSYLPFAGTTRLRAAHGVSPVIVTSLPGVGNLQNDGYICNCRKILSPSQKNSYKLALCFCQGSCPRRLVWWEGVSVRKGRGKECIYFLHEGAWGSVSFQDIWLIAQLKEHWKTFTSFISVVEGTQNKK